MSRAKSLSKRHLLYLGEISEPPQWLPASVRSILSPTLADARMAAFTLEDPSADEVRSLEHLAGRSKGIVSVISAGGVDFCVFVGSREELCAGRPRIAEEELFSPEEFRSAIDRYSAMRFTLSLRRGSIVLGERTLIMGILNVTPDSFSDAGIFYSFDGAIARAEKMVEEGADIIDVGGESTRPGSDPVPLDEEARRVLPVIEHLAKHVPVPISVDTCKAEIARRALDAGAEIVNDVSALRFDSDMAHVVGASGCPLILMHMQGAPKVMQKDPRYEALMPEIIMFLQQRLDAAAEEGIDLGQVIIDPGIGFGKTVEHNLEILRELGRLRALGRPILVGSSRKATIGAVLGTEAHDRVEGTAATVAVSIMNGAHMVRVHDVREMARVAKMTDAIMGRKRD